MAQGPGGRQERRTISSLFIPPEPTDVLIPTESILYNERKHWAILIQPFLETLVALILLTVLADDGSVGAFGAVVLLGAVIMAVVRFRKQDWHRGIAYAGTAGLILGFVVLGRNGLAFAAVLFVTGRFAFRFMKWAFYERLYITNRRIIGLSGFLGSEISTMPLTRVTDISYKTTVAAEIFRYGILRVETAGQDQALGLIEFLDKPEKFYDILIDRSTAAVGSVTAEESDVDVDVDLGIMDEDDGSGTLQP
ncbi:MAG: PH domain-containing protein [Acidimicrobiales bacterium]